MPQMPTPLCVIDMSAAGEEPARQRRIYTLLVSRWWPHPIHGPVRVGFTEEGMTFLCPCGAQMVVHYEVAQQLGLLVDDPPATP